MDVELAVSLDVAGLRSAMPSMTGDPALVAVAETLRLGVLLTR